MTGRQPYTALLDDAEHSTSDELDDLLIVYRYDSNNAGMVIYIYNGSSSLTGDVHKGHLVFYSASPGSGPGAWT